MLANCRGACFAHPEPLASSPYLVIADVEGGDEWARIFLAVPIDLADVESNAADHIREVEFVAWDDDAKMVRARKQRQLGAIVLKDQPLLNPDPEKASAALMHGIHQAGMAALPWTKDLLQWRARVEFLRRVEGANSTWPDMSDQGLLNRLEDWLPPFVAKLTRLDQVQRMDLATPLQALLTWKQQKQLDALAPSHVTVPSGSRIRVNYEEADLPVLTVRLQEMFGCEETPRIADGKIPVMIHLLSPAGRPVQITQVSGVFGDPATWRSERNFEADIPSITGRKTRSGRSPPGAQKATAERTNDETNALIPRLSLFMRTFIAYRLSSLHNRLFLLIFRRAQALTCSSLRR